MLRQVFRQAALDRLAASETLDSLLEFVLPRPFEEVRRAALSASHGIRRRLAWRTDDEPYRRVRTPTVLQMEAVECGAAALAIVLGYHGRVVTLEALRDACGISRDGGKASNIMKAARDYGMLAKGYTKSLDGLKALPLPCVVFWNFGHFLVVEGFAQDRVFVNDPATGPRTVTNAEFDAAFTGVVLAFEPGPAFRPGGGRPGLLRALRRQAAGGERGLLLLVVVSFLLLAPGLLLPLATGAYVDHVLVGRDGGWTGRLLAAVAVLVVLEGGLTWLQGRLLLRLENLLAMRGTRELFGHVLRLPMSFFAQRLSGDIAGRISLVDNVVQMLTGSLASSVLALVLVLVYLALMASYDVVLAVIGLAGAVLNVVALRATARRRDDARRRMLLDAAMLSGTTLGALKTIETVKATGSETDAFGRWAGYQARVVNAEGALAAATQPLSVVPALVTSLTIAATLVLGGSRVIDGTLTAGMLVTFQGLLLGFLAPFSQLVGLGARLQTVRGELTRLDDVLRAPPDPSVEALESTEPDTLRTTPLSRLRGDIELRGLTFGYSHREPPLIEDLNLTVRAGARVALVGSSASGKSTVARLVAGLYQPWSGQILLDDTPRPDLPRTTVTHSLAMVDQEIHLFAGSVRENISLWDACVSLEAIERAARDAAIHAEIVALPGGYDARLDESGSNLSGGQRQRVEIARALARDPTILVLDEATSALDPVTEATVMQNLKRRGCTCLIVAHRLSTIRDADEILVLENGQVVQRGTHDELRAQPGEYRRLLGVAETADDAAVSTALPELVVSGTSTSQTTESAPGELRESASAGPSASNLVLEACTLLGTALGVQIRPAAPGTPDEELLDGVARASHLRLRHVYLRDGWWRADSGPLLAFREADGAAMALLPSRPGAYMLVDPSDGRRRPVTPELAATLAATAIMFYRAFPVRVLEAWDLVRFGLRGGRMDLLTVLAAGAAVGLLALAIPISTGFVFDTLLPGGLRNELVLLGLGLVAAAFGAAGLSILQSLALARAESRSSASVQAAIWDRLLSLPTTFFRAFDVGDLGSRAMAMSSIRNVVSKTAMASALAAVSSVTSLGLLLAYDLRLGLIALLLIACYVGVGVWGTVLTLRRQRTASDLEGRESALRLELVGGITRLRVAGAERRALARWSELFQAYRDATRRVRVVDVATKSWTAAFPLLASLVLFSAVAPGSLVSLEFGRFLGFSAAFGQCLAAAVALTESALSIVAAIPLYERARLILRATPEVTAALTHPGRLTGAVRVENVSFRYRPDGPLVLDDVSLEIRPGECLAIVGPSGSGKSTLVRLLLGFDRPERGRVLYEWRDLVTLDAREVRRQIGVVLQNGAVMAESILRNIVGVSPLTVQDAWVAARMAGLAADIRGLPMGMYTYVPEGGATFSGGQRQRLMIARALVRLPRLLFFDEATSALDNVTQEIVTASVTALGASRLVIAHRLSTVQRADRIVVLSGGKVVQSGRYDELVEQDGLFAQLVRPQIA